MIGWALTRLGRWLFGDFTQFDADMLDGVTLAIQEEAERLGLRGPCA